MTLNQFSCNKNANRTDAEDFNRWCKKIIIPIIEKEQQEKISGLLIESESLRNESKNVLDKAVRAVEIAIEDGEDKAISYLNS